MSMRRGGLVGQAGLMGKGRKISSGNDVSAKRSHDEGQDIIFGPQPCFSVRSIPLSLQAHDHDHSNDDTKLRI